MPFIDVLTVSMSFIVVRELFGELLMTEVHFRSMTEQKLLS